MQTDSHSREVMEATLNECNSRLELWTPSEEDTARFTAKRETAEWLWSQADYATEPQVAKAYKLLGEKALEELNEAAEPPLTSAETEMALSVAMWDLEDWRDRDHADEWLAAGGRTGARAALARFSESIDETRDLKHGISISTHPVAVLMGRTGHDCYPNFAFAITEPGLSDWLGANRAALHEPPLIAPISIRERVEVPEIVCDFSTEVVPLVMTMTDAVACEFRAEFPHLIATNVRLGEASKTGSADDQADEAQKASSEEKNG